MAEMVARTPRIRQARPDDFPLIEGWRAAHFLEMAARGSKRPVLGQTTISTAAWCVYVDPDDRPLAAMGFRDEPHEKRRWVTDLYATPGLRGLRAGVLLGALVEELSDRDGYEIRGSTDPENTDYLEHLLARGYELCAIEFRRPCHGVE